MEAIPTDQRVQLIFKNWMTHDGMWFFHCVNEFGIEAANRVNRAAVRSMADFEARRILKAMGREKVGSLKELKEVLDFAYQVVKADFMHFHVFYEEPGTLRVVMEDCFAHKGVSRIGVADTYECGIFERFHAWFDAMGLAWTVAPEVTRCMMESEGRCFREFTIDFGS